MKRIISFLIYILLIITFLHKSGYSFGKDYRTTSTGNYDWDDPDNWLHMTGGSFLVNSGSVVITEIRLLNNLTNNGIINNVRFYCY